MIYIITIIAFLVAATMSGIIIPQIMATAYEKKLFDEPNERKLHTTLVPRLGGVSFLPVILFTLAFVIAITYIYDIGFVLNASRPILAELFLLICGLIILFLVGIQDDLIGTRYRTKFIFQFIAASFIPISGLWINNLYGFMGIHNLTPWIGIPLTLFIVVFIINAINLIDGIDGLASGLCCISLAVLGSLFFINRAWLFAILAFITLGSLLPFYYYNVFGKSKGACKKIFMGDTGSLTLGFILAFLIIRFSAVNPEVLPYSKGAIIIAFSTLTVPIFDVCRVMLVRARNKRHIFTADNNHIHHKFIRMNFSHRGARIRLFIMAILFILINIILVQYLNITFVLLIDAVIWIGLHLWFNRILSGIILQENEEKHHLELKNKQTTYKILNNINGAKMINP